MNKLAILPKFIFYQIFFMSFGVRHMYAYAFG